MATPFLFVYGTLRHASTHPMAAQLRASARYRGPARTAGRLFDLGPFPGLVEAEQPNDWVHGDLFELNDVAIVAELDRYEALPTEETEAGLFERVTASVTIASAETVTGWLYRYCGPMAAARRIASGDYFARK